MRTTDKVIIEGQERHAKELIDLAYEEFKPLIDSGQQFQFKDMVDKGKAIHNYISGQRLLDQIEIDKYGYKYNKTS